MESRKILSPEQEDFRADRSCVHAITHLGLCIEDAHTLNIDIVFYYLELKGAFPSADHEQLVRTHVFLGLPDDIVNIISNLCKGATTEFVTPPPPTATRPPSAFAAATYKETPPPHYSLTSR